MSIPWIQTYSLESIQKHIKNRTQWQLDPARAILLVHDMQNYFANFFNREESPLAEVLANLNKIKTACKAHQMPVVYTTQPGNQDPKERALLTDFWGPGLSNRQDITAIVDDIKPGSGEICLTKWRYSAFQRTNLKNLMQKFDRDQLIITGIYAHIGILATALEAFMTDIKSFVVADAIADFSREDHEMAITYISSRCGQVVGVDALLRQLDFIEQSQLSKAQMLQDVLDILELESEEITTSDNLMYTGLDSVQLMELVAKWERLVPGLSFVDIAEAMTIDEWYEIICTISKTNNSAAIPELSAESL